MPCKGPPGREKNNVPHSKNISKSRGKICLVCRMEKGFLSVAAVADQFLGGLVSTMIKKGEVGELMILTSVAHTLWREMPDR